MSLPVSQPRSPPQKRSRTGAYVPQAGRGRGRGRGGRGRGRGRGPGRGAYAPNVKAKMGALRRPFIEVKRKSLEDIRASGYFAGDGDNPVEDATEWEAYDTEIVHMNPLSFLLWSQGLAQSQHIGQAVTVKYTNMKVLVRFPQPHVMVSVPGQDDVPQKIPWLPQKYELVWGWIPAPLQLTGQTTPAANTLSVDQLTSHINLRVRDYFNARKDRLRFIAKKESTIRIVGRKTIEPDLRFQSTAPPTVIDAAQKAANGTIPDAFCEINWNMGAGGKKLWLEQTGNINGDEDLIAMYPNFSWLPFCCFVNWNYDELTPDPGGHYGKKQEVPSIAWNDITYYSDS